MYSFSKTSYPSFKAAAAEAVQRIYESGLAFRDGRISQGHNNVRADNAARAFTSEDVAFMTNSRDLLEQAGGQMIGLRQIYSELTDYDDPKGKVLLQSMYDLAQHMMDLGWQPRGQLVRTVQSATTQTQRCVRDDFNYDRAQLASLGEHWERLPAAAKGLLPDPKTGPK